MINAAARRSRVPRGSARCCPGLALSPVKEESRIHTGSRADPYSPTEVPVCLSMARIIWPDFQVITVWLGETDSESGFLVQGRQLTASGQSRPYRGVFVKEVGIQTRATATSGLESIG